jgi:imidazolonepropionase-like amidohydrolase
VSDSFNLLPKTTEGRIQFDLSMSRHGVLYSVRWVIKNGADVVKVHVTGGVLSLTDDVNTPQLTQDEIDALVNEAHALRRRTAAHAHNAEGAKRAIQAGIDSIEHGTFLDDEALDMMKAKGTVLVPTLMGIQGFRERLQSGTNLPAPIAAKGRCYRQHELHYEPGDCEVCDHWPGYGRFTVPARA